MTPHTMVPGNAASVARAAWAAWMVAAAPLSAQQSSPLEGFAPGSVAAEQSFEQRLLAVPDTASARRMSFDLARVPHIAGTRAQAATRDYVMGQLRSWGLETWAKEYLVYLPQPETVAAWLFAGAGTRVGPLRLELREPPVPGIPSPVTRAPQIPTFNAYSADGDVTAEVVYVNYGLIEDYKTLDSLGISVSGKIAIARYGRSFRGIKEIGRASCRERV